MKTNGLVSTAKQSLVKSRESRWTQAYDSRMRRFNLEVVLVALIALALLIAWLFTTWEAFQKSLLFRVPGHLATAVEKCLPEQSRSVVFETPSGRIPER